MLGNIFTLEWPPWVAGILAAGLFFLGFYLLGGTLSTNEVYARLSEKSEAVAEKVVRQERIGRADLPPWSWQAAFLVGIFGGSLVAAAAGGDWKLGLLPEDNSKGIGYHVTLGVVLSFLGGIMVMSGLVIAGESFFGLWSQCMGLSVKAILFIGVMFVEAVLLGTFLTARAARPGKG